jgi:uncharacterized protein (TIGR02266 family)
MSAAPSATRTILVADETAFVRERFAAALTEAGHLAVTAATADEALARLREAAGDVHLVVLDLQLPGARGTRFIRSLRRFVRAEVPIVVFSGTIPSAEEVRELAALGIAGYVNEYSASQHIVACLAPHLFPNNFDRRSSPRVNVSLAVTFRHGGTVFSAVTLNLGKGGLAVRTMTPVERGARLSVRFRLPGAPADTEAQCRVCWTSRNIGMGAQFENLSANDQAAIDEFVDTQFYSNRKA